MALAAKRLLLSLLRMSDHVVPIPSMTMTMVMTSLTATWQRSYDRE
jgi:hypothetical protein